MLKHENTSESGIYKVLHLKGRIDSQTLEGFREILIAATAENLALDFSKIDFVGIPAIQLLVANSDEYKSKRRHFVVVAPSAQVLKHLEVYAGRTSLRVFRTVDDFSKGRLPEIKRSEFAELGS